MSSSDVVVSWIIDRLGVDVLIAICIGIGRPIFHHKVLALRALATGCPVNTVWLLLNPAKFLHIGLAVRPVISYDSIATLLIILLTQVTTGWVVARTHRRYPIPMVLCL